MKSEWTDYAAVQAKCGNLLRNELTRNSSGNTRSQSSHLGRDSLLVCRWQVTPNLAYTLDPAKSEWADFAAVQA